MEFREIMLYKYVKDFICTEESYEERHKFGQLYEVQHNVIVPTYNPLNECEFILTSKKQDIYSLLTVIGINRGFLVSKRLLEIISKFKVDYYIIYTVNTNSNRIDSCDQYYFIYFYYDYSLKLDYSNSLFHLLSTDYYKSSSKDIDDYVIQRNISLDSFAMFTKLNKKYRNEIEAFIYPEYLKFHNINNIHLFSMNSYDFERGIFISQKLIDTLENENIKGYEMSRSINYKIFA